MFTESARLIASRPKGLPPFGLDYLGACFPGAVAPGFNGGAAFGLGSEIA
jgi:hypothetical protein